MGQYIDRCIMIEREREPEHLGVCVTALCRVHDLCNDIHMLEASFLAVMWACIDTQVDAGQSMKPLCM